ncbi:MAG: hypothetical protein CVV44_02930 [Spirochaetae bacterium HGW-Spirochaetae-1]|jgi:zinc transport system permease protein|nr:MAG: hypothetical protein CVV44_02930 [Spirochaetae bacterium HGW-Spirochaetae-1]
MFELLSYPFFQRAILAALLASLTCGIIGTYIVSRRIVFIGGSISHSSFGGIGMGYYYGFNPIIGAAVFAVFSAFSIEFLSRRTNMRTDSLIGVLWSLGMAVGIIFVFITPGYAPNLMSYLFGSILTVSWVDIGIMAAIGAVTVLIFTLFFSEILYIAFDEEFATTRGMPVRALNYLILALVALTIVITIRVVGIILVISLLTIPQVTAGLLTGDFKKIIGLSIVFGFTSSFAGLMAAHWLKIPSGASIIFSAVILFLIVKTWHALTVRQRLALKIDR